MRKTKRESNRPDPRDLLRQIAKPMLEAGTMTERDVERFARPMETARTAKARGAIVNEWVRLTLAHLQTATRRIVTAHAAQHPGPN